MKGETMTTLNKYIKHQEIDSKKRIPIDMYKLAEEIYYSESRDIEIKKGDMDLIHLIRSLIKKSNEKSLYDELVKTKTKYNKLRTKYNNLVSKLMELE
jgi:hypothetical protein